MDLSFKKCISCKVGTPPMPKDKAPLYLDQVPNWQLVEDKVMKINREFRFRNFKESMTFVNRVAILAEEEGHHPDIYIFYNKVRLELFTHAAGGLSENDFIMAAKINQININ